MWVGKINMKWEPGVAKRWKKSDSAADVQCVSVCVGWGGGGLGDREIYSLQIFPGFLFLLRLFPLSLLKVYLCRWT